MIVDIDNPGKLLVALCMSKLQLATRHQQLVNCPKCDEQSRTSMAESMVTLDKLITQIREKL